MADNGSILVTAAAGQLGAVGRTVTGLLLERGLPVRAMVRREDDRAAALRAWRRGGGRVAEHRKVRNSEQASTCHGAEATLGWVPVPSSVPSRPLSPHLPSLATTEPVIALVAITCRPLHLVGPPALAPTRTVPRPDSFAFS
jgi:hypothetical protein